MTVAGAMAAVLPVFRVPPGGGQVIVPGGHLAGDDRRDALVSEPGGDPGAQPQREVFLVAEVVEQGSGGVREFVDPEELGQWTGQVRAEVTALSRTAMRLVRRPNRPAHVRTGVHAV
ncbi:hypothetical protein [Nonomuraea sp. KM90]|uniref:hypothetical protein n=1 Tax=Nonomuraea sp. KM90 TaxID=3457428 RepID=UPI003FCD7C74